MWYRGFRKSRSAVGDEPFSAETRKYSKQQKKRNYTVDKRVNRPETVKFHITEV